MSDPSPGARDALAALQLELATRRSVVHFAHFAVSTILGLIGSGTVAKLFWDLDLKPATEIFIWPVASLSGALFLYGLVRYVFGKHALKKELVSFERLQALRRELNLEDPSVLLPQ